ncbi:MAG TPA: hypothetical protein VEW93_13805 [Acidimicrobiales bacterium]|nr:hypothetical protein [Acidimicrobiales bacterium]
MAPSRSPRPDRAAAVVVCVPGLEDVVAAELSALGITNRPAGAGALAARMTDRQLYLANVALASATRVLVEAGEVTARSFAALEDRVAAVDLGPWVAPGVAVRFRISSHRSRLVHTGAVEERLRRVWRLGPAPAPDVEAALVVVRIDRDRFSFRVDSSGAPLHHRGWRGPAAKAPLRETVAAAVLTASGWQPGQPLVDPFCGSGTLPIEAGRRAAGLAPGGSRSFAFTRWPSFAPGTWASVQAAARPPDDPPTPVAPLVARDRDAGAVAATAENAERAGVASLVTVEHGAVSAAAPPECADPGWIVANPPWGGRLQGGGDLRDLYARLGQVARERFPGWGVALLMADPRLAAATGLPGQVRLRTRAGPTPVSLVVTAPGAA